MFTYFRDRRRRAGGVTLAIACMLMCEWMRSRLYPGEWLLESYGDESFFIRSHDEALRFAYDVWSANHLRVEEIIVIPYVVLPLTLLSGYLLLWKPK